MPLDSGVPTTQSNREVPDVMAERLIVALDVQTTQQAIELVDKLDGVVSFFKIGFRMLIEPGADALIDRIIGRGKKVFLDAKMFDIPETVEQAVATAARRQFTFITVHGDEKIMAAAIAGKGSSSIKVFAVTVLTSLNDEALAEMGYRLTAKELVALRARKAVECRCDGIIASADDNPDTIRDLAKMDSLLIATPGVRQTTGTTDDHKRTATPRDAIACGADYLVVGRPIIGAVDPVQAARSFIGDMELGLADRANRGL